MSFKNVNSSGDRMKSFFTFNTLPIYDVYVKVKLLSKPTDLRTQGDRFPALKSKKKKICEIGHAAVRSLACSCSLTFLTRNMEFPDILTSRKDVNNKGAF